MNRYHIKLFYFLLSFCALSQFFSVQFLFAKESIIPEIKIEIPNFPDGTIGKDSVKLKINVSGIQDKHIIGYSLDIGKDRNEYIKKEFIRNNIIPIDDLNNSIKFIRIQCKYLKVDNGSMKYYWTGVFEQRINVKLPLQKIKVENFFWTIISKIYSKLFITLVCIIGIFLFLLIFSFRMKIVFLLKSIHYRIKQLV